MLKIMIAFVGISTIVNVSLFYNLQHSPVYKVEGKSTNTQYKPLVSESIEPVRADIISDHEFENDALRRELSLLAHRIDQMETDLRTYQEDQVDNPSASVHAELTSSAEIAINQATIALESDQEESFDQIETLDQKLSAEVVDLKWATGIESLMYDTIQDTSLSGSQINSIDCRTSICKAEFLHDSAVDALDFQLEFMAKVSSSLASGSMQHIDMDGGSQKSIVFFNRDNDEQ